MTNIKNPVAALAFLTTLAANVGYDVNIKTAMKMLADVEPHFAAPDNALPQGVKFDVSTPEGLILAARANAEVMVNIPDRKIMAIKALRQATNVGLVEAKNAVDAIAREDVPF